MCSCTLICSRNQVCTAFPRTIAVAGAYPGSRSLAESMAGCCRGPHVSTHGHHPRTRQCGQQVKQHRDIVTAGASRRAADVSPHVILQVVLHDCPGRDIYGDIQTSHRSKGPNRQIPRSGKGLHSGFLPDIQDIRPRRRSSAPRFLFNRKSGQRAHPLRFRW
jgi:hypothetical protein